MNAVPLPLPTKFRPMGAADIDPVLAIERAAYPFPWTRGNFADSLQAGYSCWVAEVAGEIVGYSILMTAADEGHLLNCCVAPAWQGRGIGRQIMGRLMGTLSAYGIACLYLEVRPSNGRAIRLYDSLGFETVGLRRHYYPADQGREDAVLMRYCR